MIALAAVGLVELAKIVRIRDFDGSGYGWLVGFQALLLADVLATAAPDWSVFFLSLAWPGLSGAGPEIFPSWPWTSLLALVAALAMSRRRDMSRAAAARTARSPFRSLERSEGMTGVALTKWAFSPILRVDCHLEGIYAETIRPVLPCALDLVDAPAGSF